MNTLSHAQQIASEASSQEKVRLGHATYSPDDNKLRFYAASRLSAEDYALAKAHGFRWAPKQKCFFAQAWTPQREDLLLMWCGDIDDEDSSLTERAECRAERFEEYASKRAADARRSHAAVDALVEHIPLGQPILIGHHSERAARRDAEKIRAGMEKAVRLWDTSDYWSQRAHSAVQHAKYKELPAVRHRRIKTLEAEARKWERHEAAARKHLATIAACGDNVDAVRRVVDGISVPPERDAQTGQPTSAYGYLQAHPEQVADIVASLLASYRARQAHAQRWLTHLANRLTYERALLEDAGAIAADQYQFEVGGHVQARGRDWLTIVRVTKRNGQVTSLTTTPPGSMRGLGRWHVPVAKVTAYTAPTAPVKPLSILNIDGPEHVHMTRAEWAGTYAGYKGIRTAEATDTHGAYRYRSVVRAGGLRPVFLSDAKAHTLPALSPAPQAVAPAPTPARVMPPSPAPCRTDEAAALREQLRIGVQVIAAPLLYPTPPELADRMMIAAELPATGCGPILEPSAGSGVLVGALHNAGWAGDVVMVEQHAPLVEHLRKCFGHRRGHQVIAGDFLQCELGQLGTFARIVMNPPFNAAADIAHIRHAMQFLKPGGVLVALCADGPRQNVAVRTLAEASGGTWEALGPSLFKQAGTHVRCALAVIRAPV